MSRLPDLADRLARGLALTDPQAQAALSRLTPVVSVGDLDLPQNNAAGLVVQAYGSGTVAGVAAQTSDIALVNPAGSGKLVVVEQVWLRVGTAGEVRAAITTAAFVAGLTTALASAQRDGRSRTSPSAVMRGLSLGALLTATVPVLIAGTGFAPATTYRMPFLLPPSTALLFEPVTVNVLLEVLVVWQETQLPPESA